MAGRHALVGEWREWELEAPATAKTDDGVGYVVGNS